jgi:hypothetical protein
LANINSIINSKINVSDEGDYRLASLSSSTSVMIGPFPPLLGLLLVVVLVVGSVDVDDAVIDDVVDDGDDEEEDGTMVAVLVKSTLALLLDRLFFFLRDRLVGSLFCTHSNINTRHPIDASCECAVYVTPITSDSSSSTGFSLRTSGAFNKR